MHSKIVDFLKNHLHAATDQLMRSRRCNEKLKNMKFQWNSRIDEVEQQKKRYHSKSKAANGLQASRIAASVIVTTTFARGKQVVNRINLNVEKIAFKVFDVSDLGTEPFQ